MLFYSSILNIWTLSINLCKCFHSDFSNNENKILARVKMVFSGFIKIVR